MSVTGYTHPSIRPDDVGDLPYFDGRFNSGPGARGHVRGMGWIARRLI